jgi:two-component system nitrate/nitrite response regulator NarL
MGDRTATVVIEARSLMREALVSLMENHSYHVVCSVASAAEIHGGSAGGAAPGLVILGALPTDNIEAVTSGIRKMWHAAKIILLFEHASSSDLQKLMASEIDACVPLFVSPHALMGTLQLITSEDLRVMVGNANFHRLSNRDRFGENAEAKSEQSLVISRPSDHVPAAPRNEGALAPNDSVEIAVTGGLSDREEQILQSLVRGHSNKVIARICSVTEATVKVHMKSILRKIRVANRTQAAIWALKNGYLAKEAAPEAARKPVHRQTASVNGHTA